MSKQSEEGGEEVPKSAEEEGPGNSLTVQVRSVVCVLREPG